MKYIENMASIKRIYKIKNEYKKQKLKCLYQLSVLITQFKVLFFILSLSYFYFLYSFIHFKNFFFLSFIVTTSTILFHFPFSSLNILILFISHFISWDLQSHDFMISHFYFSCFYYISFFPLHLFQFLSINPLPFFLIFTSNTFVTQCYISFILSLFLSLSLSPQPLSFFMTFSSLPSS